MFWEAIKKLFAPKLPTKTREQYVLEQAIDWGFIHTLEGFKTKPYVPVSKGKVIGKSGVTIGAGVDLGQRDSSELIAWGVPEPLIVKLGRVIGLKGEEALKALANAPVLSQEEINTLQAATQKNLYTAIKARYNKVTGRNFDNLNKGQQTILMSLAYQLGPYFGTTGSSKSIWTAIVEGRWKDVQALLSKDTTKYATRRKKEGEYLREYV